MDGRQLDWIGLGAMGVLYSDLLHRALGCEKFFCDCGSGTDRPLSAGGRVLQWAVVSILLSQQGRCGAGGFVDCGGKIWRFGWAMAEAAPFVQEAL